MLIYAMQSTGEKVGMTSAEINAAFDSMGEIDKRLAMMLMKAVASQSDEYRSVFQAVLSETLCKLKSGNLNVFAAMLDSGASRCCLGMTSGAAKTVQDVDTNRIITFKTATDEPAKSLSMATWPVKFRALSGARQVSIGRKLEVCMMPRGQIILSLGALWRLGLSLKMAPSAFSADGGTLPRLCLCDADTGAAIPVHFTENNLMFVKVESVNKLEEPADIAASIVATAKAITNGMATDHRQLACQFYKEHRTDTLQLPVAAPSVAPMASSTNSQSGSTRRC